MANTSNFNKTTEMVIVNFENSSKAADDYNVTDYTSTKYEVQPTQGTLVESMDFWEYDLAFSLQLYMGLLLFITGIIGNALVIATLCQKKPLTSTSLYLMHLAAADLAIMLIGQGLRILPRSMTKFDTAHQSEIACSSWFFLNHTVKTISSWTLVAITIERVIVVYLPLKAKELCNIKMAKIVVAVISLLSPCLYVHYYWTYGRVSKIMNNITTEIPSCAIQKDNSVMEFYVTEIRPWQDFVIRSVGPFIILLLCNILIVKRLVSSRNKMNRLSETKADEDLRNLAAMLLTVSFAYLVCVTPLQIMYFIYKTDPMGKPITSHSQAVAALIWSVGVNLLYTNHAINFILYTISGRLFRRDFKKYVIDKICTKLKGCPSLAGDNVYVVNQESESSGNSGYDNVAFRSNPA